MYTKGREHNYVSPLLLRFKEAYSLERQKVIGFYSLRYICIEYTSSFVGIKAAPKRLTKSRRKRSHPEGFLRIVRFGQGRNEVAGERAPAQWYPRPPHRRFRV